MTCTKTTFILILAFILSVKAQILQLNAKNFQQRISQNAYTLVYFYSSSCKFCKEFNPEYERAFKNKQVASLNVTFAKMDGPAFINLTQSYEVYSYPTVLLFVKDVPLPINFRRQRKQKELVQFLNDMLKTSDNPEVSKFYNNITLEGKLQTKSALFYGKRDSWEFKAFDVIAKRDGFLNWGQIDADVPKLLLADKEIINFSDLNLIETQIRKVYAKLHSITEQSWLRMIERKKFTIFYINEHGNKKTKELLSRLAKELPDVHFMEVDGEHDQYKTAVRSLGLNQEQNIAAVDRLYDALYIAPHPYTEASLKQFIEKAKEHKLQLYRKSQISQKPNKLTRANYDQKINTNQDVLLFLYDKTQPISKSLMNLFEFLLVKLKPNKNLLLLRCDIVLNQIEQKLGFVVKPTPKLVFLRNKMKDYPIHFTTKTISAQSVIEFIMENTTFDFEDEWAEL